MARFYPPLLGGAGGKVSLRVGPKTLANPKPTRVGKTGVQGAKPHGGGLLGVSPHKTKIRGE